MASSCAAAICALESYDFQGRLCIERFDEVEDLIEHLIVDGVDRRMIERHAPEARHSLVGGEPGRHVTHIAPFR